LTEFLYQIVLKMWFDIKILLVANDYPGRRIKIEEISLFLDCSQVGRADFAAQIFSWAEDYKSFIFFCWFCRFEIKKLAKAGRAAP